MASDMQCVTNCNGLLLIETPGPKAACERKGFLQLTLLITVHHGEKSGLRQKGGGRN